MSASLSHDLHVQVHPRDPGPWKSCKTVFRAVARVEPWLVHKAEAADTTSEWLSIVLSIPGTSKLLCREKAPLKDEGSVVLARGRRAR